RVGEDSFMVVTGGGSGMHDLAWLRAQLRDDDRVTIANRTDERFCLGLWGPRARDVLAPTTDADVSNEAFPYMRMHPIAIGDEASRYMGTHRCARGGGPCLAQRISSAGELGGGLSAPIEGGPRVGDLLWEAGREHGVLAAGLGAFDSLRLEKGYRLWGQDIT